MAKIEADALQAYWTEEQRQNLQPLQPHSSIIVPLQSYDRRIGTLTFTRVDRSQPSFTKDDLKLAQELAERAALAIANAQLGIPASASPRMTWASCFSRSRSSTAG